MITLPKNEGRGLLLDLMRELLGAREHFTLREAVDALESLVKMHRIEATDGSLLFICVKKRHERSNELQIALVWNLLPQGELFEGAQIYLELTIACGLWSSFYSKESFSSEHFESPQVENFFAWVRYLRCFRWLKDRAPLETKIELKEYGPEEFFGFMRDFIPHLIKRGLWKCDGPSCPIGHAPV